MKDFEQMNKRIKFLKKLSRATAFTGLILLFILVLLSLKTGYSQGWERHFEFPDYEEGVEVHQTPDGGYILANMNLLKPSNFNDFSFFKTDANGSIQWRTQYDNLLADHAESIFPTPDGGYIVGGSSGLVSSNYRAYIVKTNAFGDTLWDRKYGGPGNTFGKQIRPTTDNGYIMTGTIDNGPGNTEVDAFLLKMNQQGDSVWMKIYGGNDDEYAKFVEQTDDGGFILSGWTKSYGPDSINGYIIKTNATGDTTWTHVYGGDVGLVLAPEIRQTTDGGYAIAGHTNSLGPDVKKGFLMKLDTAGKQQWVKYYQRRSSLYSIKETPDGGFILAGAFQDSITSNVQTLLIRTDTAGNMLWTSRFQAGVYSYARYVNLTVDGGYVLTGHYKHPSVPFPDVFLLKADRDGRTFTNLIKGNIFNDLNSDCIRDIGFGEAGLGGWIVQCEPFGFYTQTDPLGNYSFEVDTGPYTIHQQLKNPLWQAACPEMPNLYNGDVQNFEDTIAGHDFANEVTGYGPLMTVDIGTRILRSCQPAVYTVSYCNEGNAPAFNAYVTLDMDSYITPISSSVPWNLPQQNNRYVFEIGSLQAGDCGSFTINTNVSCDANLGEVFCNTAHIYPDSLPFPIDPGWDGSSIEVSGSCIGGYDLSFTIRNKSPNGAGDMQATSDYRIYRTNRLIQNGTFQLDGGDSINIPVIQPQYGFTYRIEADQRPGHPGQSRPSAELKNCDLPLGLESLELPQDDGNGFIDIDCQEIRGSHDPNEKLVQPTGVTSNGYISHTQQLDYQINFQNKGNDTAFLVVIRDTLPPGLDPASVRSGASSHPYSFRIYGKGYLEWTFTDIGLPDHNMNEQGSHGFVKFKIRQTPGNPPGSIISNKAAIYFDFNAPVITDPAISHVFDTTLVADIFSTTSIEDLENRDHSPLRVECFPNPFSDKTYLRLIDPSDDGLFQLSLYNMLGIRVKEIHGIPSEGTEISRDGLPAGVYLYKIYNHQREIGHGKLMIR